MKGRAGYALAAWLLLCAACLLVVRQTIFNGDISAFLPGKPSEAQKILVDQLQDGPISRMLLLAIEGGNEAERAAASKAMLEQLVAIPPWPTVTTATKLGWGRSGIFCLTTATC